MLGVSGAPQVRVECIISRKIGGILSIHYPFVPILNDFIDIFNPNDPIIVGRKWFEDLFKKVVDITPEKTDTASAANAVEEKIAYKLTTFK